jgi:peptide/nickel transport system substrate-binding protein/oligopeptide transport system substrate-binding protein
MLQHIKQFLRALCFIALAATSACKTSAVQEKTADRPVDEITENAPDSTEKTENLERDALMVIFSSESVEWDFRKAFYASEAQIFTAVYEGLFTYHPFTMAPVLGAASRYELSPDKKQWTFTLRENAKYSNGDPVRAEDFRAAWFSLLSLRDAPYSSFFDIIEGAKDFRTGKLKDASKVGIQVKDGKLVVKLVSPASFFPSMLCHHSFSPMHPTMLKTLESGEGVDTGKFISNGAFVLTQSTKKQLVFQKNAAYWDADAVKLNKLILKFTDDPDEATSLWNSGQARWLAGNVNFDSLADRSGITVNPMFATHYYFIRSAEKPWSDFRIRRALTLALPWEDIRSNSYLPAKTLIFPLRGYPQVEGIEKPNIDEAVKLLAQAGFPKGAGLPELTIKISPSPEAARIADIMAGIWFEKLGVPVKVKVIPYAQYSESLKERDYQVAFMTWIGDFADPYTFLQMWQKDSNLNDAGYSDPDYEKLIQQSMGEEGAARLDTLAKAEKLLLERGTVLPISFQPAINIVDMDEIEGWFPNPLDIHPFKYLGYAKIKPLPGVALFSPKR